MNNELFVNGIKIEKKQIKDVNEYPFNIECIKGINELNFNKPVTFLIGENGVGKSTFIEALAIKLGLNPEGGSNNMQFSNYDDYSELYKHLTTKVAKKQPYKNLYTLTSKNLCFMLMKSVVKIEYHIRTMKLK